MFNERLKELRKRRGIKTQLELANLLDLSVDTIKGLESGRAKPSMATLIKIADLLDCDLDYLVGRERRAESGDLARLNKILEKMPEEKRKATIKLLETII